MGGEQTAIGTLVAAVSVLFLAGGCGEKGDETVHLRFFNAYAGSGAMSIYGPSSPVTSDLAFGERMNSFEPVDRNYGTEFKVVMDGATETFDVDLPLYQFYPQESATVLFSRRANQTSLADPRIYRHVRTAYREGDGRCRLVFDNALSVKNGNLGEFSFFPKVKIKPECTGYVERIGSYEESYPEFGRPNLIDAINDSNWFYFGRAQRGEVVDVRNRDACPMPSAKALTEEERPDGDEVNGTFPPESEQNRGRAVAGKRTLKFVWAGDGELGKARIDLQDGSIVTYPPTREYMKCIGWNPRKSKTENREKLRQQRGNRIEQCRRTEVTDVPSFAPQAGADGDRDFFAFHAGIGEIDEQVANPDNRCGFEYEIESDFRNTFVPPDATVGGTISYKPSQYYFWVLYGRPVDPRVTQWGVRSAPSRGGGFQKPEPYP